VDIKHKAEKAVAKLEKLLSESWSPEEEEKARKIIEKAMTDAVHEFYSANKEVVNLCCNADQDMAHKLTEEMKLARKALIANLSSLR